MSLEGSIRGSSYGDSIAVIALDLGGDEETRQRTWVTVNSKSDAMDATRRYLTGKLPEVRVDEAVANVAMLYGRGIEERRFSY